jgi:hypothetical protein
MAVGVLMFILTLFMVYKISEREEVKWTVTVLVGDELYVGGESELQVPAEATV